MLLQDLRFPSSTFNRALVPIMAQLDGMVDLNGNKILQVVRPGLYRPRQEYQPGPSEVPSCHLWCDSKQLYSSSIPMIFDTVTATLSMFFLWYDFGDDPKGIATQRDDAIDYILRNLQGPVSGVTDATGILPNPEVWGWPAGGFGASIDHTNAYRHITHLDALVPPWYSTRVDIPIELQGISDTFGSEAG